MSLGVSFFPATYTLLGLVITRRAVRTGVAVTGLGLLGLGAFAGIAFFRVFMAKFTDEGLDPNAMNQAFEATHVGTSRQSSTSSTSPHGSPSESPSLRRQSNLAGSERPASAA